MRYPTKSIQFAALAFELVDKQRVQLLPANNFAAVDGRPRDVPDAKWKINELIAQRLLAELATRQNDIPIYYDHQDLHAKTNGKKAVAAGWVKPDAFEFQPDAGLFAIEPKWTAAAQAHMDADEIRYVSPLFAYNADGEITRLINFSLTNSPGISGMNSVAGLAESLYGDDPMSLAAKLQSALALAPGVTEAEILQAVTDLHAHSAQQTTRIAELNQQITTGSTEPDPDKYVSIAALQEVNQRLAALQQQTETDKKQALIDANASKLATPSLKEWAGKCSLVALQEYLTAAPEMPGLEGTQSKGQEPDTSSGGTAALSAEDKTVMAALGMTEDEYRKGLT
jgi:phage I-like protein